MGTRNLTMVVSNNQTKVAQYGQWDGYPEGQGATALKIMSKIIADGKLSEFKEKVDKLSWLTQEQIDELNKEADPFEKHPYLSRDWAAQILEAVMYDTLTKEKGFMQDEDVTIPAKIVGLVNKEKFAQDSLFCEWGYVIDLDKNTFEVYKGFNKEPLLETERFHYLDVAFEPEEGDWFEDSKTGGKYYYHAIMMVKSYDLNNLPTLQEFLDELEPRDKEENDN